MPKDRVATEIAALAARYGEPRRMAVTLGGQPFSPRTKRDRVGEVCMVVRRKNGRLLTATKQFYPPGAFRLLTGGIKRGEGIEAALMRETWEETGLETELRRFLAIIEYRLSGTSPAAAPDFTTYALLLDEISGELAVQDPDEQLSEFREVAPEELLAMADFLATLADSYSDDLDARWADWGIFRAVVHRAVAAEL